MKRRATKADANLIARIEHLTDRLRIIAIKRDEVFRKLAKRQGEDCLVVGAMVYQVGRPKGKYIVFPDFAFTVKRRLKAGEVRK